MFTLNDGVGVNRKLVALFDTCIQEMIDSGEMEKLVQYWLY